MFDLISFSSRLTRVGRRLVFARTAAVRARRARVILGPENFCYAPRANWGVVIDVGVGHRPTFAPWIQEQTGAFVVLCDPTPKHLAGLRLWVEQRPRSALIERAVAPDSSKVTFFESSLEESGSLDATHTNRARAGRTVEVQGISLDDLLDEAERFGEVSLTKLDAEGAEFRIFNARPDALRRTLLRCPQWLVEFHPVPQTRTHFISVFRIYRYFSDAGFMRFSPNGTDCLFYR
ncbi:MAG: FkbM family methyltransferase [Polyangiaceae bacterium]|nr:FkbM family methyltransferase [Polyangiaceae bacterium]